MAVFQNEQEIYALLGTFFEEIKDSDPVKNLLATFELGEGYDAYVQFIYNHPEGKITWYRSEDGTFEVACGETNLTPELTFELNADTGHRFWLGQVHLQEALARQQIVSSGPLAKALKMMPQIEAIFPKYRAYLEQSERSDLLEV